MAGIRTITALLQQIRAPLYAGFPPVISIVRSCYCTLDEPVTS
jgi:hypothetical protein